MSKAPYKPRPRGTMKGATCALIQACGGDTLAAEGLRVNRPALFKYSDPDGENARRFMPIDIVRTLEDRCGEPVITQYLAHSAGYTLTSIGGGHTTDLAGHLASTAREMADVFAAVGAGLANNNITVDVAGAIVDEIDEAMRELVEMRSTAVALLRGESDA